MNPAQISGAGRPGQLPPAEFWGGLLPKKARKCYTVQGSVYVWLNTELQHLAWWLQKGSANCSLSLVYQSEQSIYKSLSFHLTNRWWNWRNCARIQQEMWLRAESTPGTQGDRCHSVWEDQLFSFISGSPRAGYFSILHFRFLVCRTGVTRLSPRTV